MSTIARIGQTGVAGADVVFIHGLAGEAEASWRAGDSKDYWLDWLSEARPNFAFWTIGYSAPWTNWRLVTRERRETMPLFDRGGEILDLLVSAGLGSRPIIFIAHSLGGLVVKQLLRRAQDAAGANPGWAGLRANTKAVVFLGTPHTGSALAKWAALAGTILRPSIATRELIRNDAPLRDLSTWYVYNATDIETFSFYETRPLVGPIVVVDQTSANPGVGRPPVPLEGDHLSIAKVQRKSDHLFLAILRLLDSQAIRRTGSVANEAHWPLPTVSLPVGRDDLARGLANNLADPKGASLLVLGAPAIGKSTLALFAANFPEVASRFGSRRCFIRLDQEDAGDAVTLRMSIARAIGREGDTPWDDVLADLGRDPGLLILDNLESSWEPDPRAVEDALVDLAQVQGLTLCCTLRGAERPSGIRWTDVTEVESLAPSAAAKLFLQVAGEVDVRDPDLQRLLDVMEGVPLAIELLAERAQYTPIPQLWREWNAKRTAMLRRPSREPSRSTSLEVSIELSLASPRLNPSARRLFRMLGRFPAGFDPDSVDALFGADAYESASALRRTRLAYDRGNRLVLLSPVREFAARLRLGASYERKASSFFLRLIGKHAPGVGIANSSTGIPILSAELGNLEAAVRLALKSGRIRAFTTLLLQQISAFQRFSGAGTPQILEEISTAATLANDPATAAQALLRAGEVYHHRSQSEAARRAFIEAGEAFEKMGEPVAQATCIKCTGDVLLDLGLVADASAIYLSALRRYRRARSALGEANCWSRLGATALVSGQLASAAKAVGKARRLYGEIGDILGEANCNISSAEIALEDGNVSLAQKEFSAALDLYQAQGDLEGIGRAQLGFAAVAEHNQDRPERRLHAGSALQTFEQLQNPLWIGEAHFELMELSDGEEKKAHEAAAKAAWNSIGRIDLLNRF